MKLQQGRSQEQNGNVDGKWLGLELAFESCPEVTKAQGSALYSCYSLWINFHAPPNTVVPF